ncbi:unnamed protein product [Cunninghamella blakesleeana]
MSSVTVVDEWITTPDGYQIFTKTWQLSTKPVAEVLLIHGFGEHCARYDHVFRAFAEQGIQSYAYDQRGWGETGKKYQSFGNNQGYDKALEDINDAVNRIKKNDIPLFLIGHSMGGGLSLNYVARKEKYNGVEKLTGVISSAPLVTLTNPVPAFKFYPLKALSHVLPNFTIQAGLDHNAISHDKEQVDLYVKDPLIHDFTTISTVGGFLDAGKNLLTIGKNITVPVLFSHGDADPINKYESTKHVYEIASSSDKELKKWPGLYHELHNETKEDRDQVIDKYIDWMKARIPSN